MKQLAGANVLVVGMARSGVSAAKLLVASGANVTINDRKTEREFGDTLDMLRVPAVTWRLGEDPDTLIDGKELIVFSSGVPFWSDWIGRARENGIPCINEMELAYWVTDADFVAITGTNGKTTTVSLTAEIFNGAGIRAHALGNIGVPACEYALTLQKGDVIAAEVTPFILVSTLHFHPRVSVILNITEDHLDWFGTMERYSDGKALVFQNQTEEDVCILNQEDPVLKSFLPRIRAKVLMFSSKHEVKEGIFLRDNDVVIRLDNVETLLCRASDIRIPGAHNLENAMAASLAAFVMGVPAADIKKTLVSFPGVAHRIETVRTLDGITYINDSKGTNPDATIKAVEAMTRLTVLILGGSDKKSDFVPLFHAFTPMIKQVVVLGQTADRIMADAAVAGFEHIVRADGFEHAVMLAKSYAHEGMNVLLSPACASYDMFRDFEERGERFKQIVKELS